MIDSPLTEVEGGDTTYEASFSIRRSRSCRIDVISFEQTVDYFNLCSGLSITVGQHPVRATCQLINMKQYKCKNAPNLEDHGRQQSARNGHSRLGQSSHMLRWVCA